MVCRRLHLLQGELVVLAVACHRLEPADEAPLALAGAAASVSMMATVAAAVMLLRLRPVACMPVAEGQLAGEAMDLAALL